jgi:arabinofuranosyltransferase
MSMQAARTATRDPARSRLDTALLATLVVALVLLALKCAWACDDAYITFRVVDNLVEGHGPRWNTAERVQAYTNPLWMLLVSVPYALTREPYFTSIALSLALTAATGLLLALRAARDVAGAALALCVLAGSKAFVDFSTSGLENPLLHFALLGALSAAFSEEPDRRRSLRLALWSSAVALTRLDALALLAPVLAAHLWRERSRRALAAVALGFLPLVAWELFSLVYYGSLIPNSAVSKLSSGLPSSELATQGLAYLADSLALDPLTLCAIAAAIAVAVWKRELAHLAVALGILLHLAYVARVGGDFMSGRFLTAPLLAAAWMLATARLDVRVAGALALAALALVSLTPRSPLRAPIDYAQGRRSPEFIAPTGIADERGYWHAVSGLFSANRTTDGKLHVTKGHPLAKSLRENGPKVSLAEGIGYLGYWSGPEIFLVDPMGLSDALLARLPIYSGGTFVEPEKNAANASRGWRVGHYYRKLPAGYLESLSDPARKLDDAKLQLLREELDLVTRAPLFAPGRFSAIARLAF